MDFVQSRYAKRREARTRAPTACQTCRLRKTRCDNRRPVCSYCAVQGVECNYPETSPRVALPNDESSKGEILQRLTHIASMLEDIKDGGSSSSSAGSLRSSFLELAMQHSSSLTDQVSGSNVNLNGSSAVVDDEPYNKHDSRTLYVANSPEFMLRWPIFSKVVTDAEKQIRSFLLDSLDNQPPPPPPPRQMGLGSFDDIKDLCLKYLRLVHRRNPVVDADKLERYAREVTVQGLGWDGPSCQVLLACALASCTSTIVPIGDNLPEDLDRMQPPPDTEGNIELAEAYFHAAKQRLGSLHTSPTDIQCFLLAGFYHRHAMRPLQAWFCFQQASCRLEVRLQSLCREQWTADVNYHNLESRLYWSCLQSEYEMQCELPLWSTGLENLPYEDPFPKYPKATSTSQTGYMTQDTEMTYKESPELSGTDEEKGWKFYIAAICSRRTVNSMLEDMWRNGEVSWIGNVGSIVEKTREAEKVIISWYQMASSGFPAPSAMNEDLEFLMKGRLHFGLEKIYRPVLYLAIHRYALPTYVQSDTQLMEEIFQTAQRALDQCGYLIPHLWYHFRHEWIWNSMRASFCCALQIIAGALSHAQHVRHPNGFVLRPPPNWPALVRLAIRTLKYWSNESIDLEIMRSTLERMYQGTCRLTGVRPDL